MKKHRQFLGFGGALLGLFLSASVLASEIDWDKSNIVINFIPERQGRPLSCSLSENSISFSELGINGENSSQIITFDDTHPCFRTAGTYNVSVELWDTAGNVSLQNQPTFTIKAADPDSLKSSFGGSCEGKVADSVDSCGLSLTLIDEFDNLVTQIEEVKIHSPTEANPKDANEELKFRAGLWLEEMLLPSSSTEFSGLSLGSKIFPLKAVSPTIQKTDGYLATYNPEIFQFIVNTPSINNDGSVASGFSVALVDKEIPVQFIPPFQITPTLDEDIHIELDTEFEVDFILSAVGTAPDNLGLFSDIQAADIENIEGHNFTPEDGSTTLPASFSYSEVSALPASNVLRPIIVSAEDEEFDANFSVISMISYSLGGQTIKYPAGGFGEPDILGIENEVNAEIPLVGYNNGKAEIEIIGFVVEGGAIRGNREGMFLLDGDSNLMDYIGTVDQADIRTVISQNAFELVRGAEATGFTADQHVVVVEGNANISTYLENGEVVPSGRNTLVIKNGNLIIDKSFTYNAPNTDSFGVMLINDKIEASPPTGNIFVKENVQNIVGTYYADGGIMSMKDDSTDATDGNGTIHTNQLLLTGMLLTKNTKGGSITINEDGEYFNPWGVGLKTDAKIYDLDYVRRYNPNAGTGTAVSGESNEASFILRMDKKASVLPPPGFEVTGSIQQ